MEENLQFKVAELIIKLRLINNGTKTILDNVIHSVKDIFDLVILLIEVRITFNICLFLFEERCKF